MKHPILLIAIATFLYGSSLYGSRAGALVGGSSPLAPGRKYTTVERLQPDRLRAVHADRLRYASLRHGVRLKTGYTDYRGILHAHAEDSSHTGGTRPELLAAAKNAGISIIMLTDHVRPGRDFINDNWRGLRDGVLFIPGAESEGFLAYPTASLSGKKWKTKEDYIRLVTENGGNIFLSHPEERLDWPPDNLDGMEIYNHHTDVKDEDEFNRWLRGALTDPERLRLIQRDLAEYPEEVFGAQQDYLVSILAKWDRDTRTRRLTGVAANDCHHNQVFTVNAYDQDTVEVGYITSAPTKTRVTANQIESVRRLAADRKPGELIAKLDFDPYERSLRYVATHILAGNLSESSVREALKQGHAYVAHDWLCDASGFYFVAQEGSRLVAVMGDETKHTENLRLIVALPVECDLKLIRDGVTVMTATADRFEYHPAAPGVYRLEAWLTVDGESRPWVYSNPIYLR